MLNKINLGRKRMSQSLTAVWAYMLGVLIFFWYCIQYKDYYIIYPIFFTFIFTISLFLFLGCSIKYDFRDIQAYYQSIFMKMKMISTDGIYPLYFDEEENEYLKILYFKSYIPLDGWNKKKSLLETYLNKRITKIENDENSKNVVLVYISKKDLPELVEWDDDYMIADKDILSMGYNGINYSVMDLNKNPHTFIAGETGSGKTNLLKCLIYQCLIKNHEVRLIDFKRGVSFSTFRDFVKVYSDYEKIQIVLQELVQETNNRLDLFVIHKVENINEYNQISNTPMSRIVVFIDELAELMRTSDKDAQKAIQSALETLTRISRAVGINLIMGLQRPDSTIINGQIKNNVSLRICGRFVDPEPSRIMLNSDIAMNLPNIRGRFIFKDTEMTEFQAFRVSSDNMKYMNYYRQKHTTPIQETISDSIKLSEDDKPAEPIPANNTESQSENIFDFNFDDIT